VADDSAGSLLDPGSHRAVALTGDAALVAAMLRVEAAWMRVLADGGAAKPEHAALVASAADRWRPDHAGLARLAGLAEDTGNPVVALVAGLREEVGDPDAAALVHSGLTSQDVLDSALSLVARDALDRVVADLAACAERLAGLAREHRDTVMAGRTLTQHAVPVTFGLVAAQWLVGVLDAGHAARSAREALPVQCGGAAGTLSLAAEVLPDPLAAVRALAGQLGLAAPDLPWHTRRTPVTRVADACVGVTDALGPVAAEVALLSRPEVGELSGGAGGSSTMPHKQNPVLAVLVRSASLQAPLLAAQVHLAASQAVDQRPDGAWHAEWASYRRLLALTLTAAAQASAMLEGLQVHARVMGIRARSAAGDLLAERDGAGAVAPGADPGAYLGVAGSLVDAALARYERGVA
jgi:3-carboxy-cis,cis-muconate cycloisomerase